MFSDMLKYLRKRAGLTQEELAKRTGLKRGRIAMYELGKREPDFETLEIFADFFNVNMSTLIGEEQKTPTTESDEGKSDYSISEKDRRFIQWFHSLSPEKQKAILISQDAPEDLL